MNIIWNQFTLKVLKYYDNQVNKEWTNFYLRDYYLAKANFF